MGIKTAVATKNKRGFTYSLTSFGQAFIDHAEKSDKPVMDIGAAYGIATLPALLKGAKVIAADIEEKHLTAIENSLDESLRRNLTTLHGAFPNFDMPDSSVSAVYISQVLPFLKPHEIEEGAKRIYNWLAPGGHVFIVSFTPFISHVKSFIPEYQFRKSQGTKWAGFIDNLSLYSDSKDIYENLPNEIMHVDLEDLDSTFRDAGFIIKEIRYFGEEEGPLPEGIRHDGKERVGLVAIKPESINYTRWHPISQSAIQNIPVSIREWLIKPFILSSALKKVCHNFNVHVKDQRLNYMHMEEVVALGNFESPLGFIRETQLGEENSPLVYARVTMPYKTYLAHKHDLENLGNRPIGETLLYKSSGIKRSDFEIKKITQDDELLFDALVHQNFFQAVIEKKSRHPELWARRSCFEIGENKLLVTEVFLANIPQYQE